MKTSKDIKIGLECCMNTVFCCSEECPYFSTLSNGQDCAAEKNADALAYIQRLESDRQQLERERDALLKDVHGRCSACKHRHNSIYEEPCSICMAQHTNHKIGTMFEWRGAKEVSKHGTEETQI